MRIIGITGGVGSGKSTAAELLSKSCDARLILTDDVAKKLMQKGEKSYNLIVERLGEGIIDETGEIDRKKLARIVFDSGEMLRILNSYTHPYVLNEIKKILEYEKENGRAYAVIESALYEEAHLSELCDEIWYIKTNDDERKERLEQSRGYTKEKSEAIISSQSSMSDYSMVSDRVIVNDGGIDELEKKINMIVKKYCEK